MAESLSVPPVLSTPDSHIFNDTTTYPAVRKLRTEITDEELEITYEIERTVAEIKLRKWKRIALQFPDEMLLHSVRVYQLLARRLQSIPNTASTTQIIGPDQVNGTKQTSTLSEDQPHSVRLTILADTSYGSCCVDEIAAEHVDADAVVHYGRACLSPTTRLPVLHVFTVQALNYEAAVRVFQKTFTDSSAKIILTADVVYASHIEPLHTMLIAAGYTAVFTASIIHDPASPIPNRVVPKEVQIDSDSLQNYQLFHISVPPTALLLTLSSRVGSIHIYPTSSDGRGGSDESLFASSSLLLRRRYAVITSLSTVSIWGILINTLSVKNYLHMVDLVKSRIAGSGKKSYLFVVGKLNAAKVANFSEIGGWVVIGCWESSLIDNKDFYRPVITPFELDLALTRDNERLWTGQWSADFQQLLDKESEAPQATFNQRNGSTEEQTFDRTYDSEEESVPPEFDLRTGRYVSHSRPMKVSTDDSRLLPDQNQSTAIARRPKGDMVAVNGVSSPAAEFLRSKRTWQGLGSDLEIKYETDQAGALVEEGRSGIARGYAVGSLAKT